MSVEMIKKEHPKSIWVTFGKKRVYYIPYFISMSKVSATTWDVVYSGGSVSIDLRHTLSVIFYNVSSSKGALPISFLEGVKRFEGSVTVHRTHQSSPMVLYSPSTVDRDDLLTQQILARSNAKKSAYIARSIIRLQWVGREWLFKTGEHEYKELMGMRSVTDIRLKEAQLSRLYWLKFYKACGLSGVSRRSSHDINKSLDACSKYMAGIFLRYVLSHGLSPSHGFLHSSSSYSSLVYDLMEPYRYLVEKAVFEAFNNGSSDLVSSSISHLKLLLETQIKSEPTRQKIYTKSLIHGSVIALRHYLTGRMGRLLLPFETEKHVGRKKVVSYSLPGQVWEK